MSIGILLSMMNLYRYEDSYLIYTTNDQTRYAQFGAASGYANNMQSIYKLRDHTCIHAGL